MFVRRLLVCFLTLLLLLPCIALGENADDGTYYTIEFEYVDENGEFVRGVAFERLDVQVFKDQGGTNIWFQWNPNDTAFGYDIPEYVQIYFWVPDGVGSAQYPVVDPATGENMHRMIGSELAPVSLLVRLPTGDEYKQFVLSTSAPDSNWQNQQDQSYLLGNEDYLNEFVDFGDDFTDLGDDYSDLGNNLTDFVDNEQNNLIYPNLDNTYTDTGSNIESNPQNNNMPLQNTGREGVNMASGVLPTTESIPAPTDGMGTLGIVYNDSTVLYASPNPSQGMVCTLPKDTIIRIGDLVDGINPVIIDGKYWYAVMVENNPELMGYMMLDAFQLMTPEQEQAHIALYGQQQSIPASAFQTKYVTVQANGVQLRNAPSGTVIPGTVSANTVATYNSDVPMPYGYDSYNLLWIYVKLTDGREGYIRLNDVAFMSPADQELYEKDEQKMPTLTTSYASSNKNMNLMLDKDTLKEIDTVRQGDIGKYMGQSTTYQKDIWLLMDFSGRVGYVKYDDMTFLDKTQEDEYLLSQKETPKLPALTSTYAKVLSNMTPIKDPSSKQDFSTLDAGQIGEILVNDPAVEYPDEKKDLLVLMQFGTKKGYVRFSAVEVLTAQAAKEYTDANAKKPDQELYAIESNYARPKASNTQVIDVDKKTPIKLLGTNDVVQFLPYRSNWKYVDPNDMESKLWILVEYESGKQGYIKLDTITFLTAAQEKEFKVTPAPIPSATAAPVTAKPNVPQVSGLMKTNAQLTVLYYWYNVGLPKAGLSSGTVVYVQEQLYDEANLSWSFVQYKTPNGTIEGYIQSSYLSPMTSAEQQAYYANNATATPKPLATYSPNSFSGYLLITKNQVNFRTGPSTTATMTQRLQYGTIVRALGVENMNDGYSWYLCESAGQTGYVRGDNIRELTVQEYQSIVTSTSYQQGSSVITPTATAKPISGIDYSSWPTQVPSANATISFQTIPPLPTGTPFSTLNPDASPLASGSLDPFASPSAGATDFFDALVSASPDPFGSAAPTEDPQFPTENSNGSPTGLIMAGIVLALLGGGALYGYSIYNKARRKQAQEQAQRLAAEARKKVQQAEKEIGGNAAVRRPVPPGQIPVPGQTSTNQQKSGQPGQPGQPSQPGQQRSGQPVPGQRPGQTASGQPLSERSGAPRSTGAQGQSQQTMPPGINPYARPQTAQQPQTPRTQEIASSMPRAQVDGKPLDGTTPPTPPQQGKPAATATASGVSTAPATPTVHEGQGPGAQDATLSAYAPPKPSLFAKPATEQKPRMPVAPAPTAPTDVDQHEDENLTPRRRRRRQEDTPQQENETEE